MQIVAVGMLPLVLRVSIVLIILYLPVGDRIAKRNRFPAIALFLPILGGLLAAFVYLQRVARVILTAAGVGRPTAAAGAAYAQIPLLFAFGVAAVLMLAYALSSPTPSMTLESPARHITLVFAACGAALIAADVSLCMFLITQATRLAPFRDITPVLTIGAFLLVVAAVSTVAIGRGSRSILDRQSALVLSGVSVVLAVATGLFIRHLGTLAVLYTLQPGAARQ